MISIIFFFCWSSTRLLLSKWVAAFKAESGVRIWWTNSPIKSDWRNKRELSIATVAWAPKASITSWSSWVNFPPRLLITSSTPITFPLDKRGIPIRESVLIFVIESILLKCRLSFWGSSTITGSWFCTIQPAMLSSRGTTRPRLSPVSRLVAAWK